MQTILEIIKPGQAFTYAELPLIKLDERYGATLALSAESVFDRMFGNKNNWAESLLREELNEVFFETLIKNGADPKAFVDMIINLTADDGLTDYGTTTDRIALISCEQYRKYRNLIPNLKKWWWTVTPNSCEKNGHLSNTRIIDPDGVLGNVHVYYSLYGVRPLLNLSSKILVSIEAKEFEEPKPIETCITKLKRIVARLLSLK